MSASRTSNKQILDAILDLTSAIKGMATPVATPTPVAIATPVEVAATIAPKPAPVDQPVKVDAAYLNHVSGGKALAYANKTGEQVVVYARRNGHGETKLAYCIASKWTGLKDKANLGAVAIVEPTS